MLSKLLSKTMPPQTVCLPAAPLPPNTVRNILNERDSSYIVNKADLRSFLERKFNRTDFEISVGHSISRWGFEQSKLTLLWVLDEERAMAIHGAGKGLCE